MAAVTRISSVEGNSQWLDGGAMFGNVPRAMWESWLPADDKNRIKLSCRGLLIEHQGQRILCETGIGAFFEPKLASRYGVEESEHVLLQSLAELGLSDADIDYVILSHLHFDHAGGLLPSYAEIAAGRSDLLFPRAHYLVGREAFERSRKPHVRDRASFIPGLSDKLEASGRLIVVDGERAPGIMEDRLSFRISHGHTPGQMHSIFRGDEHTVAFAGDLIPGLAWVHAPVTMGYDRFAEQVIDEKLDLYKRAVPEHWLLFFTHDTRCAASEVTVDEKGKYYAENPITKLVRRAI